MATLTDYAGSNDDYENGGVASNSGVYRCQGFQVTADASADEVGIYGSRGGGASGTFKIQILQGSTPNGASVLADKTFTTTAALSSFGSPAWNTLSLDAPIALVAGVQYWLVVQNLTGSANDETRWSRDNTSPSYPYGGAWLIVPDVDGSTWRQYTTSAFSFAVYGEFGPVAEYAITGVVTLAGAPVEGAVVRCIRQSDDFAIASEVTDESGVYLFSGLDDEELYHLAVEYADGDTLYNAKSLWDVVPYEVE